MIYLRVTNIENKARLFVILMQTSSLMEQIPMEKRWVFNENIDNIEGGLYTKDLLSYMEEKEDF